MHELDSRFPRHVHNIFDVKFFNNIHTKDRIRYELNANATGAYDCTHILIALGQWPAGWPEDQPSLFNDYERAIEEAMKVAVKAREELGFQLFFRSIQ